MFFKNQKVQTEHKNNKQFVYKKNQCNLSFGLNMDDVKELNDFISLLQEAIDELKHEIEISDSIKNIRNNGDRTT